MSSIGKKLKNLVWTSGEEEPAPTPDSADESLKPMPRLSVTTPAQTMNKFDSVEGQKLVEEFFNQIDVVLDKKDSPGCDEFMTQFETLSAAASGIDTGQLIRMSFASAAASLKKRGQTLTAAALITELGQLSDFVKQERDGFIQDDQTVYDEAVQTANAETVGWRQDIEKTTQRQQELREEIERLESKKTALQQKVDSQDEPLQEKRLKKEARAAAFTQAATQHQDQLKSLTLELQKIN